MNINWSLSCNKSWKKKIYILLFLNVCHRNSYCNLSFSGHQHRLKNSKTPLVGEFLTQYLSLTVSLFASLSFFSLVFFPAGSFFAWNLFCTSSAENLASTICTIWWEVGISEAQYSLFPQKWSCHAALSCAGGWCTWWPPRPWTWWQSRSSERRDCARWSPPWPPPPAQKNQEFTLPLTSPQG